MKTILILTALLGMTISISSQQLIDIYKSGSVKLVPDPEFATGNDWDKVFASYTDMMSGKNIGARKSLVLKPDGSLIVSHAYRDYYTLFGADGKFAGEMAITGSNGSKQTAIKAIAGIIGEDTFISGADNMGKMRCFDFNGKMVKTLKANYSVRDIVVLNDKTVALVGWSIWKEKFRNFVALIDYETNNEKIIWDHFTDRASFDEKPGLFNYRVVFDKQGSMSINTMPYTNSTGNNFTPQINTVGNKLVIAVPGTGELKIFDFEGNKLSSQKLGWEPGKITVEEQKEIQENYIAQVKSRGESWFVRPGVSEEESKRHYTQLISDMESDLGLINEPILKPYFSTIIKDSDDNLLFFEYPDTKGENSFNVWVYTNGGEFLCKSSFQCEDYELAISPGKIVFRNGYVYGLQNQKNGGEIPMRLVRYRLVAGN